MPREHTDRRDFLKKLGAISAGVAAVALPRKANGAEVVAEGAGAAGLTAPPLETVRVGFIGVGARGGSHVRVALLVEGVEIKAVCDIHEPTAQKAADRCVAKKRPAPTLYTDGDYAYRRMLERDDIDAVIISTPWRWHAPQVIDTLNAGKHAFVEIPVGLTVDECWEIVDMAEKTQRHCMMMENVCYGREELIMLNMCRQGVFGELLHGEGGYIHSLRNQMKDYPRGTGSWRTPHHAKRNGNLYPTHGLGPVAQYMNINRGDRFDYMTSMSSPALGRKAYAEAELPEDHPFRKLTYICGDINSSLIKTSKGRTILVQYDTTTPRPYSRLNLIQGTKGVARGFPGEVCIEGHRWQDLSRYRKKYEHPLWQKRGRAARSAGGHGGMDFLMLWRMVYCLRNGEPMDQDVYDAASWSVVGPLSEQSVASRSASVDFPDFTRGRWKTMKPLGILG